MRQVQRMELNKHIILNMRLIIAFFFILLPFLFTACEEKEEKIVKTYRIPEGLLESFNPKKGSYWIYVNDSTGETDTTYLLEDPVLSFSQLELGFIIENEIKDFKIKSNLFKKLYLSALMGDVPYTPGSPLFINFKRKIYCTGIIAFVFHNQNDTLTSGQPRFWDGSWYHCGGYFFEDPEKYQYVVNNNIYDTVKVTRSVFMVDDTIINYFVKNIGIIKFQVKVDTPVFQAKKGTARETWSLLKYNIIN